MKVKYTVSTSDETVSTVLHHLISGNPEQYKKLQRMIDRFVRCQYYGDRLNQEDLVADIVRRIYDNLSRGMFKGKSLGELDAYVLGIAKYTIMNHRRRSGKLIYKSELPDEPDLRGRLLDSQVALRDVADRVLSSLNESCREILILKFREGWSNREIAEKYDKTPNAIGTTISRCLNKAKSLYFLQSGM